MRLRPRVEEEDRRASQHHGQAIWFNNITKQMISKARNKSSQNEAVWTFEAYAKAAKKMLKSKPKGEPRSGEDAVRDTKTRNRPRQRKRMLLTASRVMVKRK